MLSIEPNTDAFYRTKCRCIVLKQIQLALYCMPCSTTTLIKSESLHSITIIVIKASENGCSGKCGHLKDSLNYLKSFRDILQIIRPHSRFMTDLAGSGKGAK